jgi:hypothetical protein
MRGQAGNHRCPVAKIGDAGKEEIAGAIKEVERETGKEKKAHSNRCTSPAARRKPKSRPSRKVCEGSARGHKA